MLYFIYRNVLLLLMRSSILVGGQAVIEGVMMRVPGAYATAVRKTDGTIAFDRHVFNSITTNNKFYGLPIIRGMIHLYESMKMGYKTLEWSADMQTPNIKKNFGETVFSKPTQHSLWSLGVGALATKVDEIFRGHRRNMGHEQLRGPNVSSLHVTSCI